MQKLISVSFYLLFFLTPLIWNPGSFELFEYNKMMFVYLLTIIIAAAWSAKMIRSRELIFKRTPLDLPLTVFLVANIISTATSISPHVSLWGYYSRSNGGLFSTISYLVLYFALVSNFTSKDALRFLKIALAGGALVALWAIPEHFGLSPSCLILSGQLTASCWVQDVQTRVFATLGQPNWLAAYLGMLIFPAFYFLITAKTKSSLMLNTLYLILFYLAFTFTYSRGATLGLISGLLIMTGLLGWLKLKKIGRSLNLKLTLVTLAVLLGINLLFGSALTRFKLISEFAPPDRPAITTGGGSTQLENGGTESGQIRLIVWKGALDIFKHYPLFGSGVETFAYSYYQYRPTQHNLVSEWDFLYNKAHNEYLNYLATTGLVGFLSYMAIIAVFTGWCIRQLLSTAKSREALLTPHTYYLILTTLSAYLFYLAQNFFGFSVVIIALFFFLFPALTFLATDSVKPIALPKATSSKLSIIDSLLYRRPFYSKLAIIIIATLAVVLLFTLARYWIADNYFAKGMRASESNNPGRAYNNLLEAARLNPNEPYYLSELGFAAASSAVALAEEDATMSARLAEEAESFTDSILEQNSDNVSFWRTAIRTYYILSTIDHRFDKKTIFSLNRAISLAPTDAKLLYNKGLILYQHGETAGAIMALTDTLRLKPNYLEAQARLSEINRATSSAQSE